MASSPSGGCRRQRTITASKVVNDFNKKLYLVMAVVLVKGIPYLSSFTLPAKVSRIDISHFPNHPAARRFHSIFNPSKSQPLFAIVDPTSTHSFSSQHLSHSHYNSTISEKIPTTQGLSRYVQNILSRTSDRQRFVTGQYPVTVSFQESPTQRWLHRGRGEQQQLSQKSHLFSTASARLLVNNTLIDQSLARPFDQNSWLEKSEQQELRNKYYASLSLEWLAEIHIPKPAYVHLLAKNGPGVLAQELRERKSKDNGWGGAFSSSGISTTWKSPWKSKEITNSPQLLPDESVYKYNSGRNVETLQPPPNERLWVSGFSMAGRKGCIQSMELNSGDMTSLSDQSLRQTPWPNELQTVPEHLAPNRGISQEKQQVNWQSQRCMKTVADSLLVCDGFLVPGKEKGGVYVVQNPGTDREYTSCISTKKTRMSSHPSTKTQDAWFYHRAIFLDLTGDGRQSILTARATFSSRSSTKGFSTASTKRKYLLDEKDILDQRNEQEETSSHHGQLVVLECPKPARYSQDGTPLEADDTIFDPFQAHHLPWKEHVLVHGPDVMFAVADLDQTDNTIEVLASQFFDKRIRLYSILRGPIPKVVFERTIDDTCGAAFGGTLAALDPECSLGNTQSTSVIVDSGSSVPTLQPGDGFSHFLVTSHECTYSPRTTMDPEPKNNKGKNRLGHDTLTTRHGDWFPVRSRDHSKIENKIKSIDGGSLFAYRVPTGNPRAWETEKWKRTTVATGFQVDGKIWNVINPGAPGFCYTFFANKDDRLRGKRPLIAVAGDCAESAYIFRPEERSEQRPHHVGELSSTDSSMDDNAAQYALLCEIECDATVGSLAIGYDRLLESDEQEPGYATIYIPCYEKDKIMVFALGSNKEN